MAKSFITEGGSNSAKGDVNKQTATTYELIMMTYFSTWFVKPEKLKNIKEMQEKMTKELDIGKTFDKLDQINPNDLEEQLKAGKYGRNNQQAPSENMHMTNRDRVITDWMIQF